MWCEEIMIVWRSVICKFIFGLVETLGIQGNVTHSKSMQTFPNMGLYVQETYLKKYDGGPLSYF